MGFISTDDVVVRMATPALPLAAVQFEPEVPGDTEPPAVFLLHGRRGDERELLPVAQELPEELHVVCFRAPLVLPRSRGLSESDARDIVAGGQGTTAWYEPELSPADATKPQPRTDQLDRSLGLVNESVAAAVAAFGLDAGRLGLLGFDQGAVVSLACLLEAPEQYDWVVALNGYLPVSHVTVEPEGVAGKPVFVSAGEHDPMVPAARSVAAGERLRELGADVTLRIYDSSHGVDSEEQRDVGEFVEERLG